MKLLSIESTTSTGSISVVEDFYVLQEIVFRTEDVAGQLVKNLDYLLKNLKMSLKNIDYFVVSTGPGSWTGIRVGISFVKGLAAGKEKKIYPVSVPESFFFLLKDLNKQLLCLIDAYRGNFYTSEYRGKFHYKKGFSIKMMGKKEVVEVLKREKIIPVGPGIEVLFNKEVRNKFRFPVFPLSSYNAFLAFEKIKRGIHPSSPVPYYGR